MEQEITTPTPEAPAPRDPKQKILKITALSLSALLLVLLGWIGITWLTDPYDNRIVSGVSVANVDLSGLGIFEAANKLKQEAETGLYTKDMVIQLPESTLTFSPGETRVKLKVWAAVQDAFRCGRSQDVKCLGLLPYLKIKESVIQEALLAYGQSYDIPLTQSSYSLEGAMPDLTEGLENVACQTLKLTPGTALVQLDVEEVLSQVLSAYDRNTFLVDIPEIQPDALPDPVDLDAIYEALYIAPVNAEVDRVNYSAIPGSNGYDFDLEEARTRLSQTAYGEWLQIPMQLITPEISLENVFFQEVIGQCETPHTNNEGRNTNLRLMCEAMNGVILQPGDVFSYNEVVGKRTPERGYQKAPAYSGLAVVNSYGGGVCQGSSTLYNCALYADLEIVERKNHGYLSSYIGPGLDATVNWGGPDFRFKNSTNFPIMIQAEVSDGYVRMKLLGVDEKDYYIELDSTLSGIPNTGYYARSYKLKYDKETGELISKEEIARSSYIS